MEFQWFRGVFLGTPESHPRAWVSGRFLFGTMLRVIVTLATGPEMDLITEPAAIRQRYTRAVHTIPENLDCCDFPVLLDLAFDCFEGHKRMIPVLQFVRKVFFAGIADDNLDFDTSEVFEFRHFCFSYFYEDCLFYIREPWALPSRPESPFETLAVRSSRATPRIKPAGTYSPAHPAAGAS